MAEFLAQLDARRLLKQLTISNSENTQSYKDYGTRKGKPQGPQGDGGDDILKKKYEELGRLLTLQHLEKNVLSSVMDVQMSSKSKLAKKLNHQRLRDHQQLGSPSKFKRDRSSHGKAHVRNRTVNTPGYVLIKIPRAAESDDAVIEPEESVRASERSAVSKKKSLKSAKVEDLGARKIYSSRQCNKDATGSSETAHKYFGKEKQDHGLVRPNIFDIPEGGEEIEIEDECEQSRFVISGEVEVTETYTYQTEEQVEMVKHEENEENFHEHRKETFDKNKRVSFYESTDDERCTRTSEELGSSEHEKELKVKGQNEEKVPLLHYLVENEILNELLHSPRPGLYEKNEEFVENKPNKIKKKKKVRKMPNEQGMGVLSRDALEKERNSSQELSPRIGTSSMGSDHKLNTTKSPVIKLWLRRKIKLIRQQKRDEKKKERTKQIANEKEEQQKFDMALKSEAKVAEWKLKKRKEERERNKNERKEKTMMKEKDEERIKQRTKSSESGIKETGQVPVLGGNGGPINKVKNIKKRMKVRKTRVHPGGDQEENNKPREIKVQNKVSYNEWLKKKRDNERLARLKQEKVEKDSELEDIIPSLGKQRIERATAIRGQRLSEGNKPNIESENSELPESDQTFKNPFKLSGSMDHGWVKSVGETHERPTPARPSSMASRVPGVGNSPLQKRPLSAKLLASSANTFNSNMRRNTLNESDGEKVKNSSSKSNSIHDNKKNNDAGREGVFLTESLVHV